MRFAVLAISAMAGACVIAADSSGTVAFRKEVRPILEEYCFDCHADGVDKGGVAFDEFGSDAAALADHELWWKAMKNLRSSVMPPPQKPQPTIQEKEIIDRWIKGAVFAANPANPDPGRVTVRRLNRVEYRNTIRDLIGVDFDTQAEFPPDDTGHGFDNMGDVLTLPPMLLEKYLAAATKIIQETVPSVPKVVREQRVGGRRFAGGDADERSGKGDGPLSLSFYTAAAVSNVLTADVPGKYQLELSLVVNERYVEGSFDYNKCRVVFRVDGKELLRQEFSREGGKPFNYTFEQDWPAGSHVMEFEVEPLTPDAKQVRSLSMQLTSVNVRGPMAEKHWVAARNHERFFPRPVPSDAKGRRAYAKELLGAFAGKAFRQPVDDQTVNRLADLAQSVYSQTGKAFEAGVAQGMVAVLASPRFLFREENLEATRDGKPYPYVDEYALASRLSYFLWSSMPDDELFRLAGQGELRRNLSPQVARMMADKRSEALIENFAGQWLQARDIETIPIEARPVLAREEKFDPVAEYQRKRFRALNDKGDEELTKEEKEELQSIRQSFFRGARRQPRAELNAELRRAMRQETEETFEYVVRGDRTLLELLDSDYTFLNERLAKHYGLTNLNVTGNVLKLVKLPPDSPRGGILTQGTFLGVTSNPTRTSPVKRGVFILDNILGTPPSPPPPDVPALEAATADVTNRAPSLRETLAIHRENALCSSCHNRMDPLGLAFENFNAMGMWRDREFDEPIDASGDFGGEEFATVKELKVSLVKNHYKEYYRTVTEKLLTYALGRGLEYYDVETVDQIVERLEKAGGRPSALLSGVVESAPFQKSRGSLADSEKSKTVKPVQQRADTRTRP